MYFSYECIEKQIIWSNVNHFTMILLTVFYSKLLSIYVTLGLPFLFLLQSRFAREQ